MHFAPLTPSVLYMKFSKEDEGLNDLIAAAREAKMVVIAAEAQAAEADARLMDYLASKGQQSGSYRNGSKIVTAKIVKSETTSVDETGLKKAIGAAAFGKITVQRVDQTRLKNAMVAGEIDPVVVAQYTTIKQRAPYIRYSEKEVEE